MSGDYTPKQCAKCKRVGVPRDDTLCKYHRIERDQGPAAARAYQLEHSRKGGEALAAGRPKGLRDRELPPLVDHSSAKEWLHTLARGVAVGRVDRDLAAEVRRAVRTWLRAHRAEVTDEVVEEIRKELDQLRAKLEAQGEPWR